MPEEQPTRNAAAGRDAEWPREIPGPPADVRRLDFERRPMVDWLSPSQLAATGLKAAVSATFGAYADQRELQAALAPISADLDYDGDYAAEASPAGERAGEGDDFWFDYAADLGDGFDPTYAVAYLLSRPELRVAGAGRPLARGRFLVLGGDQVYPTASHDEYEHRFIGPYRAAFPWRTEDQRPADLFLIPGNHDWYDGLTSFTRLFTQGRWVGGWKTRQRRSYFALRLPRGWWLWGTDVQLGTGIDLPQANYFRRIAERMEREAEERGTPARLILCTAQPTWVYCDSEPRRALVPGCRLKVDPGAFRALAWFERAVIAPRGIRLEVTLSGDLHHYLRYERAEADSGEEPAGPAQRITSGGGGAYLYPTHHMPAELALPVDPYGRPERRARYRRRGVFPPARASRRLGRWSWLALPVRNWRFALLLAAVYLFFGWMLQSASTGGDLFAGSAPPGAETAPARTLTALLEDLGWQDRAAALDAYWDVLRHSPGSVLFALLVVFGLRAFRLRGGATRWGLGGVVHGLAHLLLAGGLVWLAAAVNRAAFDGLGHTPRVALLVVEVFVAGWLLGGWLFGFYLMVTSRASGAHMDELFSSQALAGWKNFLRLRIDAAGALHVYPIAIERVPRGREWRYRGGAPRAAGPAGEAASAPGPSAPAPSAPAPSGPAPPAPGPPYGPGDPFFEPPRGWLDPSGPEPAIRLAEERPIVIPRGGSDVRPV